jgi:hypothetical protein
MVNEFYLTKDIINSKTKQPYGIKGELVKFISDHDTCYVVESIKGNRYGVATSSLSKEFITKELINNQNKKNGKN